MGGSLYMEKEILIEAVAVKWLSAGKITAYMSWNAWVNLSINYIPNCKTVIAEWKQKLNKDILVKPIGKSVNTSSLQENK